MKKIYFTSSLKGFKENLRWLLQVDFHEKKIYIHIMSAFFQALS